jgi:hypothetical protein
MSPDRRARAVAESWPADRFSRGSVTPALVTTPSLMIRGGLETLCASLAAKLVDANPAPKFRSSDVARALHELVGGLMGLDGEARLEPMRVLQEHYDDSVKSGAEPKTALQSTFVVACLSPWVAGVGQ